MGAAVEALSFLDVAQRTSNTLKTDPPSSEQEVIEAVGVDPVRVRPTGLQARAAWLGGAPRSDDGVTGPDQLSRGNALREARESGTTPLAA